jgi:hypothetical protein
LERVAGGIDYYLAAGDCVSLYQTQSALFFGHRQENLFRIAASTAHLLVRHKKTRRPSVVYRVRVGNEKVPGTGDDPVTSCFSDMRSTN